MVPGFNGVSYPQSKGTDLDPSSFFLRKVSNHEERRGRGCGPVHPAQVVSLQHQQPSGLLETLSMCLIIAGMHWESPQALPAPGQPRPMLAAVLLRVVLTPLTRIVVFVLFAARGQTS
jgi:hypothetical protein